MRSRNWGRIVFVSSESAIRILTEMIHYGMTKTAQLAVARGLAETLAGTGVTVNSVLPGPTTSEGGRGGGGHDSLCVQCPGLGNHGGGTEGRWRGRPGDCITC
jgi:NAD(P)-dependent dehydrogenase (short-subunit alcohol dehydrogenase family)